MASESSEQRERIEAGPMQVGILREIGDRLLDIQKQLKAQTPEGIVEPLATIEATTESKTVQPPFKKPWFSISIVNDGPSDCYIVVNTEKSSTTPYLLMEDETFEIDMNAALIRDFTVWTTSGTASLRVRGVR